MTNDPKANFSKALRYYMKINNKIQQDLIQDLGISSATLSQWVNGKMFPRMDKVERLATYFHVSTTDLLTDPYTTPKITTDHLTVAKLLETSPDLHRLFKLALTISDNDIHLLIGIAQRISELQKEKVSV